MWICAKNEHVIKATFIEKNSFFKLVNNSTFINYTFPEQECTYDIIKLSKHTIM